MLLQAGCHLIFPFEIQPADSDSSGDGNSIIDDAIAGDTGSAWDGLPDHGTGDGTQPGDKGTSFDGGGSGGTVIWSKTFGGAKGDVGHDLAVDGNETIYVTGHFIEAIDLGGTSMPGINLLDIFLAAYDAAGVNQWAQAHGGSSMDVAYGIAAYKNTTIVTVGYFNTDATLGGSKLSGKGGDDLFVASHTVNGGHQWSQAHGGGSVDRGHEVAVDNSGNIFVTGHFTQTADFGGNQLTSAGGSDIFVAKYTASGAHLWSQSYGTTGADYAHGVAVDLSGNVYVTGLIYGPASLGGPVLPHKGGWDVFIASYDPTGAHRWSVAFGGSAHDMGKAVAVDPTGKVFVTGSVEGTVDLGGGPKTGPGKLDTFVACYDSSGKHLWSKVVGSSQGDYGADVAAGTGKVYIIGSFDGQASFGGSPLKNSGSSDIFVASYTDSGAPRWSRAFGGSSADVGTSLAVGPSGSVYVTGYFFDTADLGQGPVTSTGSSDLFLLKLAP